MIEIQNLPYPMFELCEEDKQLLTKAYVALSQPDGNQFLCNRLGSNIFEPYELVQSLIDKIRIAINYNGTLNNYFRSLGHDIGNGHWDDVTGCKVRMIWIEKLLTQTGDTI